MDNLRAALDKIVPANTLTVFLAVLTLYLVTMPHSFLSTDGSVREAVARQIVLERSLKLSAVEQGTIGEFWAVTASDGSLYSFYGLGQSLLEVPFIILQNWLNNGSRGLRLLGLLFQPMATLNTISAALIAAIIFATSRRLGFSTRASLGGALLLGFASILWVTYRQPYDVLQETLGVAGAIYFLVSAKKGPGQHQRLNYVLGGLLWGVALITRINSIIAAPALLVILFDIGERKSWQARTDSILWFVLGVAVLAWVIPAYNMLRFGQPLAYGYESKPPYIGPPTLMGILQWLISPWRGLFVFVPCLLLLVVAWPAFHRRERTLSYAVGLLFLSYLGLYSLLSGLGTWGWGPYYLLPGITALYLPMAQFVENLRRNALWLRWLAAGLIAVSVLVQLTSIALPFEYHIVHLISQGVDVSDRSETLFMVRYSPILGQARASLASFGNLTHPQPYLDTPPDFGYETLMAELYEFNLPDWQWLYVKLQGSESVLVIPVFGFLAFVWFVYRLKV